VSLDLVALRVCLVMLAVDARTRLLACLLAAAAASARTASLRSVDTEAASAN
jgi:hypothetical protein